jgi:hypothetical protein
MKRLTPEERKKWEDLLGKDKCDAISAKNEIIMNRMAAARGPGSLDEWAKKFVEAVRIGQERGNNQPQE